MTSAIPNPSRLHAERALLHDEGACLPLRSRHGRCTACADTCPQRALSVAVQTVTLGETCNGCGRCTAVCPTQALSLPELAALDHLPVEPALEPSKHAVTAPARAPVHLECRMVPAVLHAPNTVVLPCLSALTAGHVMAYAAEGRQVDVMDRGWCATCPTGCADAASAGLHAADAAADLQPSLHPAAQALGVAQLWLRAVWPTGQPLPLALVSAPLPLAQRPTALPPAPEAPTPVDRRRFFRAALQRPAGRDRPPAPMGGDGRAAYPADARQPSPERQRQHAALLSLADRRGSSVPPEFFPALHADASCCDHRLCVALCPTAALTVADDGATAHLRLDPLRCIACGTCVRGCPEGSLSLQPHGGLSVVQTLATHHRTRCSDCGDIFTPAGPAQPAPADAAVAAAPLASICPTCAKTRRFIDDARRQLFGARA